MRSHTESRRNSGLRGQTLSNRLVGRACAICATNRTSNRRRHPTVDRLNVEGVSLTASALNFDWYHSNDVPICGYNQRWLTVQSSSHARSMKQELTLPALGDWMMTWHATHVFHLEAPSQRRHLAGGLGTLRNSSMCRRNSNADSCTFLVNRIISGNSNS